MFQKLTGAIVWFAFASSVAYAQQVTIPPSYKSAAVVATKESVWNTSGLYNLPNSPPVSITPGEQICITYATLGSDGKVFAMNGWWTAPNDGTFKPAASAGDCSAVAGIDYSYPIPSQADIDANTERQNEQFFESVLYWGEALAIIFTVSLLGTFITHIGWPATEKKTGKPADIQRLSEAFSGYKVSTSDFDYRKNALHRINGDGTAINLTKWHFAHETGEFYKITGRVGDGAAYTQVPYASRFQEYFEMERFQRRGSWVMALFFTPLSLIFWDWRESDPTVFAKDFSFPCFMVCAVFCGLAIANLTISNQRKRAVIMGPEPLKRAIDDFGPESASASPDHRAQDGLAYKPASYDASYAQRSELATQSTAAVCNACSGSRVQSCNCTGGRLLCSSCGGSGRKWVNTGWGQGHDETCSSCASRGYSECSICQGTGKLICTACGGKG